MTAQIDRPMIELKSIKHSAFASQETACYEATIYYNGKKIGIVSNDGGGGCDRFHGDTKAYAEANGNPPVFNGAHS